MLEIHRKRKWFGDEGCEDCFATYGNETIEPSLHMQHSSQMRPLMMTHSFLLRQTA